MARTQVPAADVRRGDVLLDQNGHPHTVDWVVPAKARGYLVAIFTDRSQQALGHRESIVAVTR